MEIYDLFTLIRCSTLLSRTKFVTETGQLKPIIFLDKKLDAGRRLILHSFAIECDLVSLDPGTPSFNFVNKL